MEHTFEHIYQIVREIPFGQVATYGQIAALAGNPRWSRVVGYAMRACSDSSVPCHRVIYKGGNLSDAFGWGGAEEQAMLLRAEGVSFCSDGYVYLFPVRTAASNCICCVFSIV